MWSETFRHHHMHTHTHTHIQYVNDKHNSSNTDFSVSSIKQTLTRLSQMSVISLSCLFHLQIVAIFSASLLLDTERGWQCNPGIFFVGNMLGIIPESGLWHLNVCWQIYESSDDPIYVQGSASVYDESKTIMGHLAVGWILQRKYPERSWFSPNQNIHILHEDNESILGPISFCILTLLSRQLCKFSPKILMTLNVEKCNTVIKTILSMNK